MLQFQPPGFRQSVVQTSLGAIAYYTQSNNLESWFPDNSESLPPLVFLHGFGGGASAYEWSKVYAAFATTHRIIAPDLLGWGQSAHPVRDYQVADYLSSLTEFLREVSDQPVCIVAASLTAAIAIRLAIQQPSLVRSLFLVCPSGFDDFGQSAGRRLPLQLIRTPLLDSFIYTVGATHEIAVRNFLERFLFARPERVSGEMVAAYLASAQQPSAEYAALAFLRGDLYFDLAQYLTQLSVPTQMLWGEHAQFTNVALGRRLAELNPKAVQEFQVVPDAGVLPQLEQPATVIGMLRHYLQNAPA